jgi:hypothetical protein
LVKTDTARTLDRLEAAVARLSPATVVAVGDSFHDRTAADRINVTGSATLGGTLSVSCEDGNCNGQTPFPLGTRYTVISADGGVTGTFGSVTTAVANTRFDTIYATNTVVLAVTPQSFANLSGERITLSRNQLSVATALDRVRPAAGTRLTGGTAALFDSLYDETGAGLARAYTQLSGEVHAAVAPLVKGLKPAPHMARGRTA